VQVELLGQLGPLELQDQLVELVQRAPREALVRLAQQVLLDRQEELVRSDRPDLLVELVGRE
jgi:hypothetical protein